MRGVTAIASTPGVGVEFSRPVKNDEPAREFKVGDRVTVILAGGRIVETTVRAVVELTDGVHLQVDYGHDETALVGLWQVYSPDS